MSSQTGDASWVGVTPDPPASSTLPCTRQLSCPAELHYTGCKRSVADYEEQQTRDRCRAVGHDWEVMEVQRASGEVVSMSVYCDRGCGKAGTVTFES
jgi:hypothetical protein